MSQDNEDQDQPSSRLTRRHFIKDIGAGAVAAGAVPGMLGASGKAAGMVNPDALLYVSAKTLAKAIQAKEVSSLEVVDACLGHIEAVNPKLNAVVQFASERARAEAKDADAALARGEVKGALHGVPMTIKDSLDTEGVITTGGTPGRASFVPEQDATVVARLRGAGAILLGKTNTPELTLAYETDNAVYGRTNNPYDLARTSGGSSGGAAAIVAACGAPFDIGSDTGGSIRLPSHFCGIAGLKPTSGRVPRTGHIISYDMGAQDSLTTLGPLARYVEDLELIFPIIAGIDWRDPAIVPMPLRDPGAVDLKGLSVAVHTDNGIAPPTVETAEAVQAAAKALGEAGSSIEEERPSGIEESLSLCLQVYAACGSTTERLLERAGTKESPLTSRPGGDMSISKFNALLEQWDRFRSTMLSFLEDYDVILCPVNAQPAMAHGGSTPNIAAFSYTMTYNLTGWPCVVVRCGTSPEGLPIGVQIVARPWREDVALAVGRHLETALGGWQRPKL